MSIVLTNPVYRKAAAQKVELESVHITTSSIKVTIRWTDNAGNIVDGESVSITGSDFNDVMDFTIPAGWVGAKLGARLYFALKTKIKNMLSIDGTVI